MSEKPANFIEEIIDADIAAGRIGQGRPVKTRFPPEPNGYLHIGHAKSIRLNSSLAEKYNGTFNLRFDDTNPVKEEQEYVDSIIEDVRWIGADFRGEVLYASDYFEKMYNWAVELVGKGLAYVCDLNAEQTREHRGTLTSPGRDSPFRTRSVAENLDLFARMRAGEFKDGSKTLRAKIDMASPNLNLRDPVMYRVLHAHHHRQGDAWCIYPMYDWAHGLEDSIEGITHSICTLEFEDHRPLYDWFLSNLDGVHRPRQIEFARGNLTYSVMSKRKLIDLVKGGHVKGWDDPRMPTIAGYRRRGYTAKAVRDFWDAVGVAKFNALSDVARLEASIRDHLNRVAPRRMCVLRPLKLTIANWGDGGDSARVENMPAVNNPEDASAGSRVVPFARELYIERDDFMLDPPKKFFRLAPGAEVRLRYGYWVRCADVVKDAAGNVTELICTYDPQTKGGDAPPDGRKVKGTLHWVSARHAVKAEVRLFDRLFMVEQPDRAPKGLDDAALANWSFLTNLNPSSLEVIKEAMLEPNWRGDAGAGQPVWDDGIARYQFERAGYFCLDRDSTPTLPVFNRTVTLADTWAKIAAKQ